MSDYNPNCDGAHCRGDKAVRVYPLGGGANLFLCLACAAHENRYRYWRGREVGDPARWPQVNWFQCKPYPDEESRHVDE